MSHSIRPGRSFGDRYEVLEVIPGGGMADVFRALDLRVRRTVVVKCQREDDASSAFTERFKREIEVLGSVQHPFVLPLFDAGTLPDGRVWFAVPFVADRCVRHQTEVAGREFTVSEVVQLGLDICEALSAIHAERWVHRDVKPANVLVSGHHFMLADFGIAAVLSRDTHTGSTDGDGPGHPRQVGVGLTVTGTVVGTDEYLSPSRFQALPALPADDCFALAVVLYELLTGKDPFEGRRGLARYARMMHKPPVHPHLARPALSDSLARLLMRSLDCTGDGQFTEAQEMRRALLAIPAV